MAVLPLPVSFHFRVTINDPAGEWDFAEDSRFQSVTGLDASLETNSFAEGGENRFVHALPTRSRFPNLVLKRGLIVDSFLIDWCEEAILYLNIQPMNLEVDLLNENHEPLISWSVIHAYPVRWSVSELDALQNRLAIETLELKYQYFEYKYF